MSLRLKLSLMLSAFVMLIAVFAAGTMLIFEKVSDNMATLYAASEEHRVIGELRERVSDFLGTVNNWGLTGDARFRKQYRTRLEEVYESLGKVRKIPRYTQEMEPIEEKFQQVFTYSKSLMAKRYPLGDPGALVILQQINSSGKEVISSIELMSEHSVAPVIEVAKKGEEIKKNMIYFSDTEDQEDYRGPF
jgi:CHASE3 domain sensor protein